MYYSFSFALCAQFPMAYVLCQLYRFILLQELVNINMLSQSTMCLYQRLLGETSYSKLGG